MNAGQDICIEETNGAHEQDLSITDEDKETI